MKTSNKEYTNIGEQFVGPSSGGVASLPPAIGGGALLPVR